jgi:hypothetical protein
VADSLAEDLADIGGRIGTHQKRSPALVSQPYRRSAGQRGFTHAAFAGEEDERGIFFKNGIIIVSSSELRHTGMLQQRGCVLSSLQS